MVPCLFHAGSDTPRNYDTTNLTDDTRSQRRNNEHWSWNMDSGVEEPDIGDTTRYIVSRAGDIVVVLCRSWLVTVRRSEIAERELVSPRGKK